MKSISTKKNISIGILLSLFTLFASLILHVFYTRFLVNSVGDVQYGVYSFALSITNWLTLFSSAVFSAYIVFASKQKKENGESGVAKTNSFFFFLFLIFDFVAVIVLGVLLLLILTGIVSYEQKDLLFYLLLISGIQILFSIPANIFSLYINYQKKHIWVKLINLIATLVPPLVTIPFLLKGVSIITVLIIQTTILIVTYVLNMVFSLAHLKQKFVIKSFLFDKDTIKQVSSFVLFMLLIEVVDRLNATSDKIILGSMASGNYVYLVTSYQLGYSFSEFFASLSIAILTVFIPTIYEAVTNNNTKLIDKSFKYTYISQLLLLFLFFGGFVACGREFISLWKPDHPEVFYIATILLFIRLVPLSQNAANEVQKACNKYRFRSIINLIFVVINVALSVLFIFILGYENGIWACLIGTVFSTICSKWIILSIYNRKVIKLEMGKYWMDFFKCLILSLFVCSLLLLSNHLLKLANIGTLSRFLIVGFSYVILFLIGVMFLFSKDILEIIYKLFRKRNVVAFECEGFLMRGIYKIDNNLSVIYLNKKSLRRIICPSDKKSQVRKRCFSFIYRLYSFKNNDICGEVIYRSKSSTHVFNIKAGKHFIIYDSYTAYIRDLNSRKEIYPIKRPQLFSFDNDKKMICEELIFPSNVSGERVFELLCNSYLQNAFLGDLERCSFEKYVENTAIENVNFKNNLIKRCFSNIHFANKFIDLRFSHGDVAPNNLIVSNNELYSIDWETSASCPFFYDFIHYLIACYIRNGDKTKIESYFNGKYDDFLKRFFEFNNDYFDPDLRKNYYYLTLLTRIRVFYDKDGINTEEFLENDEFLMGW